MVSLVTGSAEGDMVGTNGLPAVYFRFVAGNSPSNGTLGFRFRLGKDAPPAGFKAVAHVGIDADNNGALDLFVSVA